MTRVALAAFGVGGVAALGWMLAAVLGASVMPSYLAAWLLCLGAPMGALALVMAMEGLDAAGGRLVPVLRRVLLLLPVGALLAVPVLLWAGPLFQRPGLPAWWISPGWLALRSVVILIALSALAVPFSRAPARPRRGLAGFGLVAYLFLATLGAVDWVLALQPGLGSTAIGVLLITAQAGLAACLAAFVLAVGTPRGERLGGGAALLVAVLLAAWGFVHFVQYLVVWSANMPDEASWYLGRAAGLGVTVEWFGAIAALAGIALLPSPLGRVPVVLASLTAMALLAHVAEMQWLVTPAFRGALWMTAPDVLAMLGIGGLLTGLLVVLLLREVSHGTA